MRARLQMFQACACFDLDRSHYLLNCYVNFTLISEIYYVWITGVLRLLKLCDCRWKFRSGCMNSLRYEIFPEKRISFSIFIGNLVPGWFSFTLPLQLFMAQWDKWHGTRDLIPQYEAFGIGQHGWGHVTFVYIYMTSMLFLCLGGLFSTTCIQALHLIFVF